MFEAQEAERVSLESWGLTGVKKLSACIPEREEIKFMLSYENLSFNPIDT